MGIPSGRSRTNTVVQVVVLIAAIAVVIWLFIVLGVFRPSGDTRMVRFRIEGPGGYARVTLTDDRRTVINSSTLVTPWEQTTIYKKGDQVYLTAGNPTQSGTLSCMIYIDNREWKKDVAVSPSDKVACAGIIP